MFVAVLILTQLFDCNLLTELFDCSENMASQLILLHMWVEDIYFTKNWEGLEGSQV